MNPLTILNGGVEYTASKRDGTAQSVKISQLPIRKLDTYAKLQGDEAGLVEFFCNQQEGWDEEITLESHLEILRIGEELNADPFSQWIERIKSRVEKNMATTNSLLAGLPAASLPPGITAPAKSSISRPPASSSSTGASNGATPSLPS